MIRTFTFVIAIGLASAGITANASTVQRPIPPQITQHLRRLKAQIHDFYYRLDQNAAQKRRQEMAEATMRIERQKAEKRHELAREEFVMHRKVKTKPSRAHWLKIQKEQRRIYIKERRQYVENRNLYRRLAKKVGHIPGFLEFGLQQDASK